MIKFSLAVVIYEKVWVGLTDQFHCDNHVNIVPWHTPLLFVSIQNVR